MRSESEMMMMCLRSDDKKLIWKSYHEKLLTKDFTWNSNHFPQVDTVSFVFHLIQKGMFSPASQQYGK